MSQQDEQKYPCATLDEALRELRRPPARLRRDDCGLWPYRQSGQAATTTNHCPSYRTRPPPSSSASSGPPKKRL